jgi:hypothetical protein
MTDPYIKFWINPYAMGVRSAMPQWFNQFFDVAPTLSKADAGSPRNDASDSAHPTQILESQNLI